MDDAEKMLVRELYHELQTLKQQMDEQRIEHGVPVTPTVLLQLARYQSSVTFVCTLAGWLNTLAERSGE